MRRVLLTAGMVLVLASVAAAALCRQCDDTVYPADLGTCSACGKPILSSAFKLCDACSRARNQCQHCLGPLVPGATPASAPQSQPAATPAPATVTPTTRATPPVPATQPAPAPLSQPVRPANPSVTAQPPVSPPMTTQPCARDQAGESSCIAHARDDPGSPRCDCARSRLHRRRPLWPLRPRHGQRLNRPSCRSSAGSSPASDGGAKFVVDGEELADLAAVKQALTGKASRGLILDPVGTVRWGFVVDVFNAATGLGFTDVSFAAGGRAPVPASRPASGPEPTRRAYLPSHNPPPRPSPRHFRSRLRRRSRPW